jgi:hypothetical protein
LAEYLEAQHLMRIFAEENPERAKTTDVMTLALAIDLHIIKVKQVNTQGDEKEALVAAEAELTRRYAAMQPESSRVLFEGLEIFKKALPNLIESGRALARMNIDDAARYVEESHACINQAQALLDKAKDIPYALQRMTELIRGLGALTRGQQLYVNTLRDALLGQVSDRHRKYLVAADNALREGISAIDAALPVMRRFGFAFVSERWVPDLKAAIDFQRDVIRNLGHVVERAMKPAEVMKRSSPRFFGYFACTFIVVLFALKTSGLAPVVAAKELVALLVLSFIVSATCTFGYEIGLKFVDAMRGLMPLGDSAKADAKTAV